MTLLERKLPVTEKRWMGAYGLSRVAMGLGAGAALGVKIAIAAGVTTAAATSAAALLTPIGWGLAGVAACVLIGYGVYKLARYVRNKTRQSQYSETIRALNQPGNPPLDGTPMGRELLGKLRVSHAGLFDPNGNPLNAGPVKHEMLRLASEGLMRRSSAFALEAMTERITAQFDRANYNPGPPAAYNGNPRDTWDLVNVLGVDDEVMMKNCGSTQRRTYERCCEPARQNIEDCLI